MSTSDTEQAIGLEMIAAVLRDEIRHEHHREVFGRHMAALVGRVRPGTGPEESRAVIGALTDLIVSGVFLIGGQK